MCDRCDVLGGNGLLGAEQRVDGGARRRGTTTRYCHLSRSSCSRTASGRCCAVAGSRATGRLDSGATSRVDSRAGACAASSGARKQANARDPAARCESHTARAAGPSSIVHRADRATCGERTASVGSDAVGANNADASSRGRARSRGARSVYAAGQHAGFHLARHATSRDQSDRRDDEVVGEKQADDLLEKFRAYHKRQSAVTLADLRNSYDLLVLKILSLVQDGDPPLAKEIDRSRSAIWDILADQRKFIESNLMSGA
jgi:hypothetical protein